MWRSFSQSAKRNRKYELRVMKFRIQNSKFVIRGKVVHGEHYGKALGFPTANLDRRGYVRRKLKVGCGVYAGWAEIAPSAKRQAFRKHKAAIVIGPMDKKALPKIEAHLIGFKGGLYGKYLNLYLYLYLRPFKKFKTEAQLKRQITKDISRVKKLNT